MKRLSPEAEAQKKRILAFREMFRPSPVRLQHVPDWLRRRILKAHGCRDGMTDGWSVLHNAAGPMPRWLDHFGSTTLPNGKRAFVSEPYGFTHEMATELQAFCEPMGLRYHVSANAWWNPPSTVRIVIEEPDKEEPTC